MKSFIHRTTIVLISLIATSRLMGQTLPYPIVDTKVHTFTNTSAVISAPTSGSAFYGQDATYQGNEPSYTDNGNMTITDNITGLTWQKNMGTKITYSNAVLKADTMTLGGYTDWRVPTIKELFSLALYNGRVQGLTVIKKFIDTIYFDQPIGDTSIGERQIDAQTWSSTHYKGLTMNGDSTLFGMNFVDGRIKGYPKYQPGSGNTVPRSMYFRMVRGNTAYGNNNFTNNNDSTISDAATGLMWQQADDGITGDWQNALSYAENLTLAGYTDWRLPNIKELNSIVDYTRSPSATNSPAIDPIFSTSTINDPDGNPGHFPYFWSSTTLQDGPNPTVGAAYIPFGKAYGKMNGVLLDTHGAGAMRSDPKTGLAANYPQFFGPQGDALIVFNNVRCVRTISSSTGVNNINNENNFFRIYPNPASDKLNIVFDKPYSNVNIEIQNGIGQTVKWLNLANTANTSVDLSQLEQGIYFVRISNGSSLLVKKVIK